MRKRLSFLITGGTGSFGQAFTRYLLRRFHEQPLRIVIYSRDELKQSDMRRALDQEFPGQEKVRFFLGDVRDRDQLMRAMVGSRFVIHAAALKQVPLLEYNPLEAVKTNILGAANVIYAAIERGMEKVVALSTDKACAPVNLYGSTKLVAERLFVQANNYSHLTRFACVRYGNVINSRGSVLPIWKEQFAKTGEISVTDPTMTRFWVTLEQASEFVYWNLCRMQGGEIFVPKLKSVKLSILAETLFPTATQNIIGRRPGEKHDEILVGGDEQNVHETLHSFIVYPSQQDWAVKQREGMLLPEGFVYSSGTAESLNKEFLLKLKEEHG